MPSNAEYNGLSMEHIGYYLAGNLVAVGPYIPLVTAVVITSAAVIEVVLAAIEAANDVADSPVADAAEPALGGKVVFPFDDDLDLN